MNKEALAADKSETGGLSVAIDSNVRRVLLDLCSIDEGKKPLSMIHSIPSSPLL
jgi:hypothetical protein